MVARKKGRRERILLTKTSKPTKLWIHLWMNPLMGSEPSWSKHLPKTLPPNTAILGTKPSTHELWVMFKIQIRKPNENQKLCPGSEQNVNKILKFDLCRRAGQRYSQFHKWSWKYEKWQTRAQCACKSKSGSQIQSQRETLYAQPFKWMFFSARNIPDSD
jgi:hypothetical protein